MKEHLLSTGQGAYVFENLALTQWGSDHPWKVWNGGSLIENSIVFILFCGIVFYNVTENSKCQ